jgi:hypothetical protein
MRIIREILGFAVQCIGLVICIPCLLFITVGGWIVDLGDTLRMSGD